MVTSEALDRGDGLWPDCFTACHDTLTLSPSESADADDLLALPRHVHIIIITTKKQDRQALLKAKYRPRVAAASFLTLPYLQGGQVVTPAQR